MASEFSVVWSITAAITWGIAAFSGGEAAKRHEAITVVIIVEAVGSVLVLALAVASGDSFPGRAGVLWGAPPASRMALR